MASKKAIYNIGTEILLATSPMHNSALVAQFSELSVRISHQISRRIFLDRSQRFCEFSWFLRIFMNFAFLPIAVVASGRVGSGRIENFKNRKKKKTSYLKSLKKAANNAQILFFDIFQKNLKIPKISKNGTFLIFLIFL